MNAFPKIFTIGQKYIQNIFEDEVIIEEKLDGSQFSFMKIDGELICRSKGKIQEVECPDKLFQRGINYLLSIKDNIPENLQFFCEYLSKEKHNTLCYERIPQNYFMLFGIYDIDKDLYESRRICLQDYAEILQIDCVPLLYQGKINSLEQLKELLNTVSFCGKSKIEGVVVKNYNKDLMIGGRVIPIMCGKFVSEEFKEVHQKNWSRENTGKGKWQTFKESFCTEARWLKALFYLRDNGELDKSPRDIGKLMKRVNEDITEEEKENIKEFLWKEFGNEVLRTATKGLPQWYKERLAKESFND